MRGETRATYFEIGNEALFWSVGKKTADEGRIVEVLSHGVTLTVLDRGQETGDIAFYPWAAVSKLVLVEGLVGEGVTA